MIAFLCLDCADKIEGDYETLLLGILKPHTCELCGREVDPDKEPYRMRGRFKMKYEFVRKHVFDKLKAST
jgi:hypothetical protein